jgi:hypothetical protein
MMMMMMMMMMTMMMVMVVIMEEVIMMMIMVMMTISYHHHPMQYHKSACVTWSRCRVLALTMSSSNTICEIKSPPPSTSLPASLSSSSEASPPPPLPSLPELPALASQPVAVLPFSEREVGEACTDTS